MNTNLRKVVNLLKIINEIRLTGGISFNLNTGTMTPDYGYMVSLKAHEETVTIVDEEILRDYITKHLVILSNENAFLGCWFDGTCYVLDVSEHYELKRDALFWAIVRDQKSIWDCEKRDEVRVKHKNLVRVINNYLGS